MYARYRKRERGSEREREGGTGERGQEREREWERNGERERERERCRETAWWASRLALCTVSCTLPTHLDKLKERLTRGPFRTHSRIMSAASGPENKVAEGRRQNSSATWEEA